MNSKKTVVFFILFFLLFCFQLIRSRYDEGVSDEHFYITLGYRLAQGDALFVDDWHIAQLIGYLLYPCVQVYLWFNHSTEGIVLAFRYGYIVLHGLTTVLLYLRYRQYGWISLISGWVFFMFTPLGIMNLSYNTMGIDFMVLAILFYGFDHRIFHLLSGLVFSFSVLCTPYLVLLYLGTLIIFVYRWLNHRLDKDDKNRFVLSFIGITISLFVFIAFVLSRASIAQIIASLPHIIDPSHQSSIVNSIFRLGYQSLQAFGPFLLIQLLVLFGFIIKKQWRKTILNMEIPLIIISWIWLYFVSQYRLSIGGYACIYLPIVLYAFMVLMVEPRSNTSLVIPLVLCMSHSILVGFSSNIGIRSVANISISAVFFALIVIFDYFKNNNQWKPLIVLSLLTMVTTIGCKAYYGYGEPNVMSQSNLIVNGPLKGLYTDKAFLTTYQQTMSALEMVNQDKSENIILVTNESWPFLELVKPSKNYSTYIYLYTKEDYMREMKAYIDSHGLTTASIYIFENRFDITTTDFSFMREASIHMMN